MDQSTRSSSAARLTERPTNTSTKEWGALLAIVTVGLVVRVPFWPRTRDLGDALNYAIGALHTHVAHPPGSVGYCMLMGLINVPIRNISFTLNLVSMVASVLSTVVCHRVAKLLGMGAAAALSAAALYGFSINSLEASLIGGPHILEGFASLLLGGLVWKAVCTRRLAIALLATFVFAAAGAIRPTTTLLMVPLWIWMLAHSSTPGRRRRVAIVLLHLLIAVPVIALWNFGNAHYMTAAGYGGQTYQNQVLITSTFDFANLSTAHTGTRPRPQLAYHMPGAELLSWLEVKSGLRLMPHVPDWPTPSLSRALHLLLMQTLKQGWWLVLSLPIVVIIPFLLYRQRRWLLGEGRSKTTLFTLWIAPPMIFFMVGHMGALTYLQVYLGALSLLTAQLLIQNRPVDQGFANKAIGLVVACTAVNVLFFTTARPLTGHSRAAVGLDLLLLQFDGYARAHNFGVSRDAGVATESDQGPSQDYRTARTDEQLLEAARRNQFLYLSPSEWTSPPSK